MSSVLPPTQALRAYQAELAAAGVAPLETSDEQEAELQRLALEILKEELAAARV
jgi:hypothetical protein